MKDCPNCGRPTLRTEDWVCQWCGYPLLSKSYKKIPKTYREIKEESLSEWGISKGEQMSGDVSGTDEDNLESMLETLIESEKTEEIEEEATEEYTPESEPEEEEESLTETGKVPKPDSEPTTKPEDEQGVNALPEEISELALEPPRKRAQKPVRKAKIKPKREPKPAGKAVPEPENKNESEQVTITEPEIKKGVEIEGVLGIEQGTVMETVSDQKIKDEVSVRPEQMDGKTPISVDELNLVFSGEKAATNTGLMGRTLQVAGVVDKIFLREHLDIRYIILVGARRKGIRDVRCTFEPEQSSALRRLAEGQKVIVQGEYEGQGRNSLFKNCAIIG